MIVIYGNELASYSFPNHPFSNKRLYVFKQELDRKGLIKKVIIKKPEKAGESILNLFHTDKYIKFVKEMSRKGNGYLDYGDTPAFKNCYEASCYVVGSTIKALNLTMKNKIATFNPISGLHHAFPEHAEGFCIFNDPAIAINYAKKFYNFEKILYVDIDAHHCNGVFYSFYNDPKVYIADIHQDNIYPGTGNINETGGINAKDTKLNIPLPAFSDDKIFYNVFDEIIDFTRKLKPELIIFQCGADSLTNDPITSLSLTKESYKYATENLKKLAKEYCKNRILVLGGGGYNLENVADAWTSVIEVLI